MKTDRAKTYQPQVPGAECGLGVRCSVYKPGLSERRAANTRWAMRPNGSAQRAGQQRGQKVQHARTASARISAEGAHAMSAGGRASASTSAGGAIARSAGARASASTSAGGAIARSAGARASASTSAGGAIARSAGGRASASTNASGAHARSAGAWAFCQHQRQRSTCK
jgi:hypothetical protein